MKWRAYSKQPDHHNLWQLKTVHEVLERLDLRILMPRCRRSPAAGCCKAALGRALVSNPRVLLLDEPTNIWISKLSTGWKGF